MNDAHLIIFVLSIVGFVEAIYLLTQRMKKRPPVCVIGQSCATVWESPYSKTFGIGNEVLGMIFYGVIGSIEYFIMTGATHLVFFAGEMIILAIGFFMSCYYVYLEWRIIQAWCFWCTLSAVIVWIMALVRVVFGG